jgi:toxin HigB-1
MILSYRDKRTREFAEGKPVRAFQGFARQAEKRRNHFEALGGDRKGQYSIRINRQWRICFEWAEGTLGPSNVEITDYH